MEKPKIVYQEKVEYTLGDWSSKHRRQVTVNIPLLSEESLVLAKDPEYIHEVEKAINYYIACYKESTKYSHFMSCEYLRKEYKYPEWEKRFKDSCDYAFKYMEILLEIDFSEERVNHWIQQLCRDRNQYYCDDLFLAYDLAKKYQVSAKICRLVIKEALKSDCGTQALYAMERLSSAEIDQKQLSVLIEHHIENRIMNSNPSYYKKLRNVSVDESYVNIALRLQKMLPDQRFTEQHIKDFLRNIGSMYFKLSDDKENEKMRFALFQIGSIHHGINQVIDYLQDQDKSRFLMRLKVEDFSNTYPIGSEARANIDKDVDLFISEVMSPGLISISAVEKAAGFASLGASPEKLKLLKPVLKFVSLMKDL